MDSKKIEGVDANVRFEVMLPPNWVDGCLIGKDWMLVNPKLFDRWEARGLFQSGPSHYWHTQDVTKPMERRKHSYGTLWGLEQVNFDNEPAWQPGEAVWAGKRVQTYYPKEGVAMGSTDPRPTPTAYEAYDHKVRALVEKTRDHDYVSPADFSHQKEISQGLSSILKDYGYFETKEGVLVEWGTLKYTGRKIKTFISKVPSIPNPLPPSAFEGYQPIASENFDMYLRPSGLTGLREVEWQEGPFDGVAIRFSGFWFARWGKVKGRGRIVSYVAMPTDRYKEAKSAYDLGKLSFTVTPAAPSPTKSEAPNSIYTLRDAKGMEVLPEVFDWYVNGGTFVDGPFSFTKLEASIGGGTLVTKLYGRLKGGIILNAFKRKPFSEVSPGPKPDPSQQETDEVEEDDWDEDDDEDNTPMIRENPKPKLTVGSIGPNRYFRLANHPDKLVVYARVGSMNAAPPPIQASNSIPCVVIIDGRVFENKGGTTHHVGSIRWLLPFSEVEELEITERPEFTVKG
jgi:hypothetical protein